MSQIPTSDWTRIIDAVDLHSARVSHPRRNESPDGRYLIASNGDAVRLWTPWMTEGKLSLPGHLGGIPGIAVNQEGIVLASARKDRTVRIWDTVSGRSLKTDDRRRRPSVRHSGGDGRPAPNRRPQSDIPAGLPRPRLGQAAIPGHEKDTPGGILERTLDIDERVDLIQCGVQVIDADLESGVTLPHAGLIGCALADLGGLRPHQIADHQTDAKPRAAGPADGELVAVSGDGQPVPGEGPDGVIEVASSRSEEDHAGFRHEISPGCLTQRAGGPAHPLPMACDSFAAHHSWTDFDY
jgi:WD domain, G-beta repeat